MALPRPASALTPVRTACGTLIGRFVSATFGTVEFAVRFSGFGRRSKSFCEFGAGDGCLSQMLFAVLCVIRAGFITPTGQAQRGGGGGQ